MTIDKSAFKGVQLQTVRQRKEPPKSSIRWTCKDCGNGFTYSAAQAKVKHKCPAIHGSSTRVSNVFKDAASSAQSKLVLSEWAKNATSTSKTACASDPQDNSSQHGLSAAIDERSVTLSTQSLAIKSSSVASVAAISNAFPADTTTLQSSSHCTMAQQQTQTGNQSLDENFLLKMKYQDGTVEQLKQYLDYCILGGKSRSSACNEKKAEPSPCNCHPYKDPGWQNIFVDAPDPLLCSSALQLESYCGIRTYFWVPELFYSKFVPHMPCPSCGDVKGFVHRKGWNSTDRIVMSLNRQYRIISKVYFCNRCQKEFRGHDEEAIKRLPFFLQQRFPAIIYPKSAIDKSLASLLARQVVNGQSYRDFRLMISEMQNENFMVSKLAFMTLQSQKLRNDLGLLPTRGIPNFGEFSDDNLWAGSIPSQGFLQNVFQDLSTRNFDMRKSYTASLTGDILCGDHTFAIAAVPSCGGGRLYEAMYTVMNEKSQVLGYYFTNSTALKDIKCELKDICKRYDGGGPQLFYSDRCCYDRGALEEAFPSLTIKDVSAKTKLQFKGQVYVIGDLDGHKEFFSHLTGHLIDHRVVGFDLEWEAGHILRSNSLSDPQWKDKTAIIQISAEKVCGIYQVRKFGSSLPAELVDLLIDESIAKAGVGINADATKLKKEFAIEMKNTVCINGLYKQQNPQVRANKSLKDLCELVLRKRLDKNPSIRLSKWASDILSEQQILYAATDAFVGYMLYQKLNGGLQADITGDDIALNEDDSVVHQQQRVCLDAFHLMNRYPVSKQNVLYPSFIGMLRDAIFLNSEEDLKVAESITAANNMDGKKLSMSYYINGQKLRRHIPESGNLTVRVDTVIQKFRALDSKFINSDVLDSHQSVLKHLELGCLSDHPDINFHTQFKSDAGQFTTYRSSRGSNKVENFNLLSERSIAAYQMNPLLFDLMMSDVVFMHNVKRAVIFGELPDIGCFRYDLLDQMMNLIRENAAAFKEYAFYDVKFERGSTELFGCQKLLQQSLGSIPTVSTVDRSDGMMETSNDETVNSQILDVSSVIKSSQTVSKFYEYTSSTLSKSPWSMPKVFKTVDELKLFVELHNDLIDLNGQVDLAQLANDWNSLLKRCYDNAPELIVGKYYLKNVSIIKKFLLDINIKMDCQNLTSEVQDILFDLRKQLQSNLFAPKLKLDAKRVNPIAPSNVPNQSELNPVAQPLPQSAELDFELNAVVQCPSCSKAWKVLKNDGGWKYFDNHGRSKCNGVKFSADIMKQHKIAQQSARRQAKRIRSDEGNQCHRIEVDE
ncbi:hypothetical protein MP228_011276 [Amoeboaphelidium protococcarum]|nr:hypothetical protein MP228_011276 [Amoeboaphelidium protococcarum]